MLITAFYLCRPEGLREPHSEVGSVSPAEGLAGFEPWFVKYLAKYSDQVYSNTRVPTQVNTNQHESDTNQHESHTSQHESTRVRHDQHESDTNQHESDTTQQEPTRVNTSQLNQETDIVYRSFSW